MDAKSKIRIHVIGLLTKQFVNDNLSNSGKSYRSKCDDNPEPSFTLCDEGVETRWQGPVALERAQYYQVCFCTSKSSSCGTRYSPDYKPEKGRENDSDKHNRLVAGSIPAGPTISSRWCTEQAEKSATRGGSPVWRLSIDDQSSDARTTATLPLPVPPEHPPSRGPDVPRPALPPAA